MYFVAQFRKFTLVSLALSVLTIGQAFADQTIKGQVLGGGAPIAKSTVTLWEASAGAPKQLAQTKTNGEGHFEIRSKDSANDMILWGTRL